MKAAEKEKHRIEKIIELRREFYDQILNKEVGEYQLDNQDIFKIDREQLYNEIWELSVSKIAKKYNISHAKLKQACIDSKYSHTFKLLLDKPFNGKSGKKRITSCI